MSKKAFISFTIHRYYYQFMQNIEPDPLEGTIFNEIDYIICGRRAERSSAQEGIQDTVSVTIALLMLIYTVLMDKNKRNKQKIRVEMKNLNFIWVYVSVRLIFFLCCSLKIRLNCPISWILLIFSFKNLFAQIFVLHLKIDWLEILVPS